MPSLVVPFRGAKGKSRLGSLSGAARQTVARAMLEDVVAACTAVGPTFVVGPPELELRGATVVRDPGGGQGPAVRAGLETAMLAAAAFPPADGGSAPGDRAGEPHGAAAPNPPSPAGTLLIVNADLPCVTARDLLALAGAAPPGGLAYAPAADGTTNALALDSPLVFRPVYGPGSAERFAALGPSRRVDAPNLVDDVDTVADLERLEGRLGPHTRRALASLHSRTAA